MRSRQRGTRGLGCRALAVIFRALAILWLLGLTIGVLYLRRDMTDREALKASVEESAARLPLACRPAFRELAAELVRRYRRPLRVHIHDKPLNLPKYYQRHPEHVVIVCTIFYAVASRSAPVGVEHYCFVLDRRSVNGWMFDLRRCGLKGVEKFLMESESEAPTEADPGR